MTARSEEKPRYAKLIGLLPVFTSMLAMVFLYALDITFLYEPKHLLGITNTVFTALIPLVVAFFAARTFLGSGSLSVLLMGCGMLGFGLCAESAGWLRDLPGGANFNVTVYNTGALLGSLCHLAGAILNRAGKSNHRTPVKYRYTVVAAYSSIALFSILFSFATLQHVVPPFFIQGEGPTALRQVVLGLAILFYALSSLSFMNSYFRIKSDFLYWYSLCLAMLALGLLAFYVQKIVGSPIGWVGRISNYVGAVFSMIAVFGAVRSGKSGGLPLEEVISGFFVEAEANFRYLVEAASDAIFSFDHENRIILWNHGAEQIFGYSKAEAIGSPVFGALIPEDHKSALSDLMEASRGFRACSAIEIVARKKNGDLFPVEVSAFGRKLAYGRVSTCILRDITERKHSEEALRLSEEKFALAFANNPAAIIMTRLEDGLVIELNDTWMALTGYSRDEAIGRSVREMSIWPTADASSRFIRELQEKGFLRGWEQEFLRKSGETFVAQLSAQVLSVRGEKMIISTFVDITGRKCMEEELRRSRDELELRVLERTKELVEANKNLGEKAEIIDLAHDAVIVRDSEGGIVFWSRGARETYGFTREQALGRPGNELLKTFSPVAVESIEETVLEKGEWKGELEHTRANGERIIVDSRWALQAAKDRDAPRFIEINRDITSRKIAEERFRRADRAFRTLSECNQAMVRQGNEMELLREICRIVVDIGGYRMAWVGFGENDARRTVRPIASAGYDEGYLKQAKISWADSERGRGPTGTAIRTGKIVTSQNALLNPSYAPWRSEGTNRGYAASVALPLVVERKIIGALTIYASEPDAFDEEEAGLLSNLAENLAYGIGSIRVAEERRRSEKDLRVYASRLEVINKELQDFAFVAAHDLQEPLRKIQTFCDLLIKRYTPALEGTGKEHLERVQNSAARMRLLLQDLLAFSRVASRQEPFNRIDLGTIVREAGDVFEATIKETGALIEAADMPVIEADGSQMLQLFQNLIGNALKYRSDKPPRISIRAGGSTAGIWDIYVEDNSIGFGQEFAERIFKPFQRLHTRSGYEGTGMGLAICRKIVERHGGTIRAESEPGVGSTFIIQLPEKQTVLERVSDES